MMLGQKIRCEHCGTELELKRMKQRFCSAGCRSQHWDLAHPRIEIEKPFKLSRTEDGRLMIVLDEQLEKDSFPNTAEEVSS